MHIHIHSFIHPSIHTYADNELKLKRGLKIIIQGVQPSLVTPMLWLCDTCSHPDNFLHIIIYRSSGKNNKTKNNSEKINSEKMSTNNNNNNNKKEKNNDKSETKKKVHP